MTISVSKWIPSAGWFPFYVVPDVVDCYAERGTLYLAMRHGTLKTVPVQADDRIVIQPRGDHAAP